MERQGAAAKRDVSWTKNGVDHRIEVGVGCIFRCASFLGRTLLAVSRSWDARFLSGWDPILEE